MISETFFSSAGSFGAEEPTLSAQVIALCIVFALSREVRIYYIKKSTETPIRHQICTKQVLGQSITWP